jgi:hypothetical protein
MRGFPSVVFCTAGLKIDEQEATRFLLLSPETTQVKLKHGVTEALDKEVNSERYKEKVESNPERKLLKERIKAIKDEAIKGIMIDNEEKIKKWFFEKHSTLKPRHQRDVKRLLSIIKGLALLNIWQRRKEKEKLIKATDEDIEVGFNLWSIISYSQELNLPPYVYQVFKEVVLPAYQEKGEGLSCNEIAQKHLDVYGRPIPEWQLRRDIIPMLEGAGLLSQERDPDDRRRKIITPINYDKKTDLSEVVEEVKKEFDGKII